MTVTELLNYLQQMIDAEHGEECLYFVDQDESVYLVTDFATDDEGAILLCVEEDCEEGHTIDSLYEALSGVDEDQDVYLWDAENETFIDIDDDWDVDDEGSPYMTCEYEEDDEDDEDDEDCEDCEDYEDDEDCEGCCDCDDEDDEDCCCGSCDCDDEDCSDCEGSDEDEEDEDEDEDYDEDDESTEDLDGDDYYADAEDD